MKTELSYSGPITIKEAVQDGYERAARLAGVSMDAVVGRVLLTLSRDPSQLTDRSHVVGPGPEGRHTGPEDNIGRRDVSWAEVMSLEADALASAMLLGQDTLAGHSRAHYHQLEPMLMTKLERRIGDVVERLTAARKAPVPCRVAQRLADQMIEHSVVVPVGFFTSGLFRRSVEYVLGVPEGLFDRWEPDVPTLEAIADMVELGHVRKRRGPRGEPQYQITSRGVAVANALLPPNGRRPPDPRWSC